MVKFVHTADWQIGKVFRFVDDGTAGLLQEARLAAIVRLGEVALKHSAGHVLVAGDVYDMEALSPRSLNQPLERMRKFEKVTWHLMPGNHDPHRPHGLAQQGAAAILVTDENIEAIRDAARELETARSRLSSAATLVAFDMPSNRLSKIEVDGAALAADQTSVEAVEGTTIMIPDYGSISVQPAIKDRDKLIAQQHEANESLNAALEDCGVKSVEVQNWPLGCPDKTTSTQIPWSFATFALRPGPQCIQKSHRQNVQTGNPRLYDGSL